MNRAATLRCLALAALLLSAAGCTGDCAPRVVDGWIRSGPPAMPMHAGFGRIENGCAAPLAITGASSDAFDRVSLHRTTLDARGTSRMRAVPALVVPANDTATLAPGGLHLMLEGARQPLEPGQRIPIAFSLRDGGILRGEFEVR